jgi:AhpD family alkylhydroperoxidase
VTDGIAKGLGFVPNLISTFAGSQAALGAYLALDQAWSRTSFGSKERQIVLLAASVENGCRYCAAAHATMLKAMRVDAETVAVIRNRAPLADPKWNTLVAMTREIVGGRGFVAEAAKRDFLAAGYDTTALMELVVGVALATMGDYLDHLNPIPIDPAFAAEAR